ncbi:MAG: hypothetical protein J3K34DRAFT_82839 [Monoraphidium minutum]|nr:MAG: hypothetical protein J3K34DRAFT_82839 [Monoraphidium minutum]
MVAACPHLAHLGDALAQYDYANHVLLEKTSIAVMPNLGLPRALSDGTIAPGLADIIRGHPALTNRTTYCSELQYVAVDYQDITPSKKSTGLPKAAVAYGQVLMICSCKDTYTKKETCLMFVRYLVRPNIVVDPKSKLPDGAMVPGKGFLVHRARDSTPVTLQPLVWEEMHMASMYDPNKSNAKRRLPDGAGHDPTPVYAAINLASVRGEALVFENPSWGNGHFVLFDLNDHPTSSQLQAGVLPRAWQK